LPARDCRGGEAAAPPEPRVELGERLRRLAHSAIDVSDGLAGDLAHILERSNVGASRGVRAHSEVRGVRKLSDRELEKNCVLSGGDDYELAFTAPRAHRRSWNRSRASSASRSRASARSMAATRAHGARRAGQAARASRRLRSFRAAVILAPTPRFVFSHPAHCRRRSASAPASRRPRRGRSARCSAG
jgi:thiamine monophosphate kinase